jgi:hypothetical protein
MRPSESDRARWAEQLAQVEEEIDASVVALKESTASAKGTIAELRKRSKKLLRYITGKENEPLEFPAVANFVASELEKASKPAPLDDSCDPAWMKHGGYHQYDGDTCGRCGKLNPVNADHRADPKDGAR